MSTSPLPPSVPAAPQDFFTLHTPAPPPGLPDSLFPLSPGLAPAPLAPASAPVPSTAALPARSASRPPRPPRSAAPLPTSLDPAVAALAAVTAAADAPDAPSFTLAPGPLSSAAASVPASAPASASASASASVLAPAPPPLPVPQPTGRKPALGRSTRGVKKLRKPRSPDVAASPAPAAAAVAAAAASPSPAPCKTSLRKSNKPQPFLRLIDNLCNVFAAANAPVTAKTKKERNAAHAKKSDLKAQKYVEVLEKMAVAAAHPASPPSSPPRRRHHHNASALATPSSAADPASSPGPDVKGDTSPETSEKEKDKLAPTVSIKDQAKAGKSPAGAADKRHRQQREDVDRASNAPSVERGELAREEDEITGSTDVVKSTVSDAMSTSSSVATNSVTRSCRCPEVCKKDNAQDDVCLCEVPDSLRRIICDVFPFANKVEPQLSARARAANGGSASMLKCEKRTLKDAARADVPVSKPQSSNETPTNEDDQGNTAMLRSIPSLQRSDRSLSRMMLTPSSKEIDNIPSFSQILAAGVSMAMDTPPEYKNKYDLYAAVAGSDASLTKSGNVLLPEGIDNEFVGRTGVDTEKDNSYGGKKQADSLCANPSPDTVQTTPFGQQERGSSSATPDLYLSPNRWDFGFTMLDQPMLSASNGSEGSPSEETPFYANFVSP